RRPGRCGCPPDPTARAICENSARTVRPVARRTFACLVRDFAPACLRSCVAEGVSCELLAKWNVLHSSPSMLSQWSSQRNAANLGDTVNGGAAGIPRSGLVQQV